MMGFEQRSMSTCLLFDCDGTLVDSERLCNVGLARAFQNLGVILDADDLAIRFRGWQLAKILEVLELEYSLSLPDGFVSNYRAMVSQLFEEELKPIEGIEEALANLPQPKAVVSSGPAHKIKQALRVCGLSDYFGENIFSSYDVRIWKPDPGIYLRAAEDMGFTPALCSVIEDSHPGVEAGYKAGMATYFYNVFDEPCPFPKVTNFKSMLQLQDLLNH